MQMYINESLYYVGKVFGPPPVKLDVSTTTDEPLNLKKVQCVNMAD